MEHRPNKEQLQPTGDWIIVMPIDVSEKAKSGLFMPDSASRVDKYAKVLKTGPGYWQNGVLIKPYVKEGQTVMFKQGRGLEMRFDGENILFMTERDLLAVVE